MNRKRIFYTVGLMMKVEAVLLLLPLIVALIYGEACALSFAYAAAIALAAGFLLTRFCKTDNQVIYAREGFVTVAMCWLAVSAVGALPFTFSGEVPS